MSVDTDTPVDELGIDEAVDEIDEIIETFEDGEIDLADAKPLRKRGEKLIEHVDQELDLGDGTIIDVDEDTAS